MLVSRDVSLVFELCGTQSTLSAFELKILFANCDRLILFFQFIQFALINHAAGNKPVLTASDSEDLEVIGGSAMYGRSLGLDQGRNAGWTDIIFSLVILVYSWQLRCNRYYVTTVPRPDKYLISGMLISN